MTDLSIQDNAKLQQADKIGKLLWGWGYNPEDVSSNIYNMAERAMRYSNMKTGQIVVDLGLATEREVEAQLATKPQNLLAIEHLSRSIDGLLGKKQMILALSEALPFYEQLQEPHALMKEGGIRAACKKLEAVIISTPRKVPCLVFSDIESLKQYQKMGRDERGQDPIFQNLGELPLLAVGSSVHIQRLNSENQDMTVLDADEQTSVFMSSQAQSETQRLLVKILDFAVEKKVSNIAIQPEPNGISLVRVRRNGIMIDHGLVSRLNKDEANGLYHLLHRLTNATYIKDKRRVEGRLLSPADGNMIYKNSSAEVFIRASFTNPDSSGLEYAPESISLRLQPRDATRVELKNLRIHPKVIKAIDRALRLDQGHIMFVGPTGSGKSTACAGVLSLDTDINGTTRNRMSAEEPVERIIPNMVQHTVSQESPFPVLMRAILRQDPDLVFIGEMRDPASATTATRVSTSGHICVSTAHANDSLQAYRVVKSYISNTFLTNESAAVVTETDLIESLSLIIAQRLLPMLCLHCRVPAKSRMREYANLLKNIRVYSEGKGESFTKEDERLLLENGFLMNEQGCEHCDHTGAVGEIPVNEFLQFNQDLKDLLHEMSAGGAFQYRRLREFRSDSMFSMALSYARAGKIPVGSVLI